MEECEITREKTRESSFYRDINILSFAIFDSGLSPLLEADHGPPMRLTQPRSWPPVITPVKSRSKSRQDKNRTDW